MSGQDFRHGDRAEGNFSRRFSHTSRVPFAAASIPVSGVKNMSVVADHEHDGLWLKSRDTAVIEAPEHVLRFVTADADIDGLEIREMLRPPSRPTGW